MGERERERGGGGGRRCGIYGIEERRYVVPRPIDLIACSFDRPASDQTMELGKVNEVKRLREVREKRGEGTGKAEGGGERREEEKGQERLREVGREERRRRDRKG